MIRRVHAGVVPFYISWAMHKATALPPHVARRLHFPLTPAHGSAPSVIVARQSAE